MLDLLSLQALLDNIAFGVAFLTLIVYWVGAAWSGIPLFASLGAGGMVINNLVIAVLLGSRWLEAGYFPLSNLYESLFFLAWGVTTLHLVGERWSQSHWVGAVTAPVVLGITAFAALVLPGDMQAAAPLVPALQSNWLMMHVTVMMLSYAALLVGSLVSMAFLLVTRGQVVQLRGDSFGLSSGRRDPQVLRSESWGVEADQGGVAVLTRSAEISLIPQHLSLPEILDNTSYRLIGLGFPLLTIGIIAGAVWANEAWGTYWSWDPKETWALITWLVFAAYLHARITKGWQGRRPAIVASLGFAVIWVCYLGVNLLGKGLHSYGWFL